MIKAVRDTVIVRQEYQEKIGTIIIPKGARKHQLYDGNINYITVSIGPKCPYALKPGDRIEIQRHEGVKFTLDEETYWMIKARWVLGIWE